MFCILGGGCREIVGDVEELVAPEGLLFELVLSGLDLAEAVLEKAGDRRILKELAVALE
ncbi:MAG: hypothetical protein JXQ75_15860 [Phycisphaerae bacterium]|nr:hypothetical protein [Phycisphaerae bacterium]